MKSIIMEHLIKCVKPIIEEAAKWKSNNIEAEVEARLGHVDVVDYKFITGLQKHDFYCLLKTLEDNTLLKQIDWIKIEELIYANDVRMRRKPDGVSTFVKKITMKNIDLTFDSWNITARISFKTEAQTHMEDSFPMFIRLKERKSFIVEDTYSIDCTKVWSGKNVNQALNSKCKYEVEIEILQLSNNSDLLSHELINQCIKIIHLINK